MPSVYPTHPSRSAEQDESIMSTNDSSIVSKRSVERLYYSEPHFFGHFVKKYRRRSPLINRGYWLRMHAIEQIVRQFLEEPDQKWKIVLILGSGYDTLPFRLLAHDPILCQHATFIDVDYPQLISKKVDIIKSTPQLCDFLTDIEKDADSNDIYLKSDQYHALGCDLNNVAKLDSLLARTIDISQCMAICTAEVSITYMDTKAANALIGWAAQYDDMRFCLLEQFIPDSPEHPFAQNMIEHFQRLHTPLRSVLEYPKLQDQERRFANEGWSSTTAKSLWDVWCDPSFTTPARRKSVDHVEPFDEWEEFNLFASHYFLLIASSNSTQTLGLSKPKDLNLVSTADVLDCRPENDSVGAPVTLAINKFPIGLLPTPRRFGMVFKASSRVIGLHGGLGNQGRCRTTDFFSLEMSTDANLILQPAMTGDVPTESALPPALEPRMCHTITRLTDRHSLLVGGRASPARPMKDCWYLSDGWRKAQDLPRPLFRHCASSIMYRGYSMLTPGVLVYGGKTSNNRLSPSWLLWREAFGWEELDTFGTNMEPVFGASMAPSGPDTGILIGGMTEDGTISPNAWQWSLSSVDQKLKLNISKCNILGLKASKTLGRLGAQLVPFSRGFFLVGGVTNNLPNQEQSIMHLSKVEASSASLFVAAVNYKDKGPHALLVGHNAQVFEECVLLLGGGAICFSFGNVWNRVPVLLRPLSPRDQSKWEQSSTCESTKELTAEPKALTRNGDSDRHVVPSAILHRVPASEEGLNHRQDFSVRAKTIAPSSISTAFRCLVCQTSDFDKILSDRKPTVINGLNVGSCTKQWTLERLKAKVGSAREVVVHQTTDEHMDFLQKNFTYKKKLFGTFMDEVAQGSKQYLRSLSVDKPSRKAANLASDFLELAPDFTLPPQLDFVNQNMHSSVVRISGPVIMWLHYDVMANVLCQVIGRKRLLLYPPSDVSLFSIPPGASSSPINCFDDDVLSKYPSLALAHPHEIVLQPGEILYIPPLWLHTVFPLENASVSVNVFFRDLETGYAYGKDIYGNRDVQAYEKGRTDIQKIVNSFVKLPRDMASFYLERLADELKDKACQIGTD